MLHRRLSSAVLATMLACPAQAAIFDRDDRVSSTDSGAPVGVVDSGPFTYGSGFLVGQCHVLTAKHVVGSDQVVGKRIHFRLQPWRAASIDTNSSGVVILAGEGKAGEGGYERDWALILLDHCLGETAGFYSISDQGFYLQGGSKSLGPGLIAMGYPSDRGRHRLSIDPACAAWQRTTVGLRHDCATAPGGSGGPILAWNAARSRLEAVAINVAGFRQRAATGFTLDRANLAVELSPVRTMLNLEIGRRAIGLARSNPPSKPAG